MSNTKIAHGAATIEGIYICDDASGEMKFQSKGTLVSGSGLQGDRYAKQVGTYSALKEPGRQLTIVSADGVEAALAAASNSQSAAPPQLVSIGNLRRNVVLRGISSDALRNAIGCVVQLGSTHSTGGSLPPLVYVHRNTVPCMYNERRNQAPGLMECLWETGGVSCEVIRGGDILVGETVTILSQDESDALKGDRIPTDGGKPSSFYVRPKLRSADMVRELTKDKQETKNRLDAEDKEGLLRLQQSYESVGLKF